MQQTLATPVASNECIRQSNQQYLTSRDQVDAAEQHALLEQDYYQRQPQQQPHSQYQQQQQQHNYNTLSSLNDQGLSAGHYNAHMTSQFHPQQYFNGPAMSSNACNAIAASYSSSSSSSESSKGCQSPCLSPSSSNSNLSDKGSSPSIGVNLRVTGQCSQGGRKYMEDYFSVAYQQSENAKDLEYAFIGIYDGHGGAEAATFAKERLMMEIINQRLFWSDSDHDVLRAIREGYIATHYAMWREQDKWPRTANGLPSTAGTTATVAFIRREKIYIGHVGDSAIVLGYQNENENIWRAKQLTVDHKPESVEESTRIMKSGGKVVVKSGVPRVVWNRPRNANHRGPIKRKTPVDEIPFLAVARSLGDLWSYNSQRNEFVVSPDPDVKVIPIDPNTFRCLIFGTDGLWNVVTPTEAVNLVREKEYLNERLQAQRGDNPNEGPQWTNPSKSLVEKALKTWSAKKMRADNTSVVTVILYPPGQGTHHSQNHSKSSTPSFGLEYTQVQARIPDYDDDTSYKEMAMKYLPPEEYRNFNYYADDTDPLEDDDTDEEIDENDDDEESHLDLTSARCNGGADITCEHNTTYPLDSSSWNWQHTSTTNSATNDTLHAEHEETYKSGSPAEIASLEEGENDNATEQERVSCVVDYQNYLQMDAEEANSATDAYINSFTESYNAILAVADRVCASSTAASVLTSTNSNSNSSSNSSNCQSISPPNMHALIEEQHQYQQQCMSQEDGYSLTKLETRREQRTSQSAKSSTEGVETFKIFHQQQQQPNANDLDVYYQQHSGFAQQKPFELHSLLQQEREEEQQVAYERQQMQNKYNETGHHSHQVNAYASMELTAHEPETTTLYVGASMLERATNPLSSDDDYVESHRIAGGMQMPEVEKSIQINEISSSCSDKNSPEACGGEEMVIYSPVGSPIAAAAMSLKEREGEHGHLEEPQHVIAEPKTPAKPMTRKEAVRTYARRSIHSRRSTLPHKRDQSNLNSTPAAVIMPSSSNVKSPLKRSKSYLFANIPNENVERVGGYTAKITIKRQKMSCSTLMMTPPAASSTPMISRQLRSSSNNNTPMDYGKRTLRTRNSITKDLKAKSALVQASIKFGHHSSVARKLLRTAGATVNATALMDNNASLLRQEQVMSAPSRRSHAATGNTGLNSVNHSIKGTRDNGTSTMILPPKPPQMVSQLNLRSRQNGGQLMASSKTSSQMGGSLNNVMTSMEGAGGTVDASTTTVIKRASLVDRRTVRSMHTRSSARVPGQPPQASFSKTTRSQSAGTSLAVPPPSPKLINAAAMAVAAATRARSCMLAQKHADGRHTSIVKAIFGRRGNLRSDSTTPTTAAHTMMVNASNATSAAESQSSCSRQVLRGRVVKKFKR